MKLTLLKPQILARTNGGDISIIEYFRAFRRLGGELEVLLLQSRKDYELLRLRHPDLSLELTERGYRVDGLDVHIQILEEANPFLPKYQDAYEEAFLLHLEKFQPDFAFAHYTDFFSTSSLQKWNPKKTFIFQTDNEFPRLDKLKNFPGLLKYYEKIENFLVASDFMQEKVKEAFPHSNVAFLPNIIESLDIPPKLEKLPPSYWLFVNPVKEKGVDFVIDLAKHSPNEKFLFVGNWDRRWEDSPLPNIQFVERQADVEKIFQAAHALLFPSHWEEAFGRLPLEAMHYSVPVLASPRGALPQTLGGAGLILDLNVERWLDAMNQVKSQRASFEAQAKERVQEYRRHRDESLKEFWKQLEITSSSSKG